MQGHLALLTSIWHSIGAFLLPNSYSLGKIEGAKPLQNISLPFSFQGEGDKGGEVYKQHYIYFFLIAVDSSTSSSRAWADASSDRDVNVQLGVSSPCSINCLKRMPFLVTDNGSTFIAKRFMRFTRDRYQQVRIAYRTPTQLGLLERFHRTLKEEEVYLNEYTDFAMAYHSIGHFIDVVYQHKRIHSALGYMTPAEYESAYLKNLAA